MTINIAVVTNEALVLGCDSTASTTQPLLDPFRPGMQKTKGGRYKLEFDLSDLSEYVTDTRTGAAKMFPLHLGDAPVAATTAGLAKLNDRTMDNFASEFKKRQEAKKVPQANVEVIAKYFLTFMRKQYRRHFTALKLPEQVWSDVDFMVGGYGKNDQLPSLYRVHLKKNELETVYLAGEAGVAWLGQSDAVHRLMFGYDAPLKAAVEQRYGEAMDALHDAITAKADDILKKVLKELGESVPKGMDTKIAKKRKPPLPWGPFGLSVSCANLPLQEAVDFAAFLVNLQSARDKFTRGVATVGGRTHVGVLTRADGFRMLNEPDVAHTITGFMRDV